MVDNSNSYGIYLMHGLFLFVANLLHKFENASRNSIDGIYNTCPAHAAFAFTVDANK